MKTPCVAVCKNSNGICSGCHRTMTEIVEWTNYSDEQRATILNRISGENETHRCPNCGEPAYCGISAGEESCWCFDVDNRDTSSEQNSNLCLCRKCLLQKPVR